MIAPLSCYRCGTSLSALSLPLARLDECPQCRAQLHVCRMCEHYAPRLTHGCSEDDALEVRDKESANFCDYFKPSPRAHQAAAQEEARLAEAALRALFGEAQAGAEHAQETFGPLADRQSEEARRRAESLFKK